MKTITITIEEFNEETCMLHTKEIKLTNTTFDLVKGINLLGECIESANDVIRHEP